MSRFSGHFVLGDLRKFAEQHGDIIGSEHVHDVYMWYWGDVTFK